MSRLTVAGFVIFFGFSAGAEEPKPPISLGKDISVPANLNFSTNVSPDGQAVTVLFGNLEASIEPVAKASSVPGGPSVAPSNQTSIDSKTATLNLPYATDLRSVSGHLDVRGYRLWGPGAKARLVVCIGETTKVINLELPKAKSAVKFKGKLKESQDPKVADGNFEDRVEFTIQKHAMKPVCQVTIFLVVEHDSDKADAGSAVIQVDSIDLEFGKTAKNVTKS